MIEMSRQATAGIGLSELGKLLGQDYDRRENSMESPHYTSLGIADPLYMNLNDLARSNGPFTILPTPLLCLHYNPHDGFLYTLYDGLITYDGRYCEALTSQHASPRSLAQQSQNFTADGRIYPCSYGVQSDLRFTIRESRISIILLATLKIQGRQVMLGLSNILHGMLGMMHAEPCEHPPLSDLDISLHDKVVLASVEAPRTGASSKVSIVQTANDSAAQILACEMGRPSNLALLQRYCCLNCAVRQAEKERVYQVIVS